MSLIKHISKYNEFTKGLFIWYNKHYKYPLANFIELPEIMQIGVISEYIIDKYNIAYHFDIGAIVIYYYNPELNVNEILAKSEEGKFTYTIYKAFDLIELNYIESNKRALYKVIEMINEPF